jgi:hypothetical protein
MAKAEFSKNIDSLISKLDLNLSKKLVTCYIWSVALCGAETCIFRKVHRKQLGKFEMRCWRRMEKIIWTDRVENEDVLSRGNDERYILHATR